MMRDEKLYKTAKEQLDAYIRDRGMRESSSRNIILGRICQLRQPFTASQLEEYCADAHLSRATFYNALNLFISAQIVKPYDRGYGQTAAEYELNTSVSRSHMQLVCRKCGRTASFYDQVISRMVAEHKYTNFNMQNYTLVVYGECKVCRRMPDKKRK
ncbi:MAG: transcriptional repressor [Paludibacteraceae bacterium]|nr:transcriptional repressor [Paludibacteraceae bacterium]